ncbi:type II toxin-antitoxin system HicB family antitoxin [Klebsiella pneumoniae]|uniref:type II toxin-antitoxin system HicB family antitoxin n=1 Tax=Klebsiella pneumoniae complex TaxID=3390273 RepID=UPI000AE9544B|nr:MULTISPECIES: type II toxin-antitoxin system HicB family antitoxin [Klebsiella]EJG9788951.1 type II toxin-antitoxin system HicB family antitoxin [Klebsiella pneumoniae]EKU6509976.1 type II toxin-antitoxin system HicB family antitoxin [Klebsiella pneumoniae]MCE0051237.1 type II toxin-antitoxin system HicB family antitoxin [Klebsiella quasipneumoniae subsp. quasipneumoniae]MCU4146396.1 type II toxin-antitoxin system HicB family antitoxin [Klebsiella quasipneumoniae]MCU4147745.1 type II toxin-
MNNLMKYKGYYGSSSISIEDGVMHGKLECINDLVTYEGSTVAELRAAFEEAVDDYLLTCEEIGKSPDKTMSGSFNVRIGEYLHKKAYLAAKSRGMTLNDYVKQAVEDAINGRKEVHYHFEKPRDIRGVSFISSRKRTEETYWEVTVDNGVQH